MGERIKCCLKTARMQLIFSRHSLCILLKKNNSIVFINFFIKTDSVLLLSPLKGFGDRNLAVTLPRCPLAVRRVADASEAATSPVLAQRRLGPLPLPGPNRASPERVRLALRTNCPAAPGEAPAASSHGPRPSAGEQWTKVDKVVVHVSRHIRENSVVA